MPTPWRPVQPYSLKQKAIYCWFPHQLWLSHLSNFADGILKVAQVWFYGNFKCYGHTLWTRWDGDSCMSIQIKFKSWVRISLQVCFPQHCDPTLWPPLRGVGSHCCGKNSAPWPCPLRKSCCTKLQAPAIITTQAGWHLCHRWYLDWVVECCYLVSGTTNINNNLVGAEGFTFPNSFEGLHLKTSQKGLTIPVWADKKWSGLLLRVVS